MYNRENLCVLPGHLLNYFNIFHTFYCNLGKDVLQSMG